MAMTNLSLSELLAQEGSTVSVVGSATRRPLFQRLAELGGTLKATGKHAFAVIGLSAAVIAMMPTSAHALDEFQPAAAQAGEGSFQMDLSALNSPSSAQNASSKTPAPPPFVTTHRQGSAPASAWPKFQSNKDVEAYFLDPDKGNNLFAALATRMENLVTTVYPDPARGRNIGIGYNMDAIGLGQARQDLAQIGMKKEQIAILMNKDSANYGKVRITPNQAVSLLMIAQPRYENIAKDWLGEKHWQKLDANQRASISYLAYQTGGNIDQFRNAKQAIQSGKDAQAQKHLVTYYQDGQGDWQRNDRFAKHVGSMWQSPQTYAKSVGLTQTAAKWSALASSKAQNVVARNEVAAVAAPEGDTLDDLIVSIQRNAKPPEPQNQLDALGQKLKSLFGNAGGSSPSPSFRP